MGIICQLMICSTTSPLIDKFNNFFKETNKQVVRTHSAISSQKLYNQS